MLICTHLSDQMWGAISSVRGWLGLPQLQAVVAMVEVLQLQVRLRRLQPVPAVVKLRRRGHKLQRGARRRLAAVVRRRVLPKGRRRQERQLLHLRQLHIAAAHGHVLLVLVDLTNRSTTHKA